MEPKDSARLEIYQEEREILRKAFDKQIYLKYKNRRAIPEPLLEHLSSRISYFDRKIKALQDKQSKAEAEMQVDDESEEGQTRVYQKKISECHEEVNKVQFGDIFELPKIDLKLFNYDGNIGNWIQFWNSFQFIAEDPKLSNGEKYIYLLQSTKGEAHDFVKDRNWQIDDFKSLIKDLKRTFGSEDMIILYYVRELLNVIKKTKTNCYQSNLKKYYKDFRTIYYKFRGFRFTTKQYSKLLVPLFEETIPTRELFISWYEYKGKIINKGMKEDADSDSKEKDMMDDYDEKEEIYEEMRRFLEIKTGSYHSYL